MSCPRCSGFLLIKPPVSDGGVVMQEALCQACGRSQRRFIAQAEIPTPRPYEHSPLRRPVPGVCLECGAAVEPGDGRSPDRCLPCRKRREATHRKAREVRRKAGLAGAETGCWHCKKSLAKRCVRHGGPGPVERGRVNNLARYYARRPREARA